MKKLNCWEFNGCGRAFKSTNGDVRTTCPASVESILDGIHGGMCAGRACWTVAGTICKGKPMGTYAQKLKSCKKCSFYKEVRAQEGVGFMDIPGMLRHAESGAPVLGVIRNSTSPVETMAAESLFHDTLVTGLKRAYRDCGYYETRFAHMVSDMGAVKAVKRMLNKHQFLYGTSVLRSCGCIDSSAERLVLDYRFSFLFDENERLTALSRIRGTEPAGLQSILLGIEISGQKNTH